MSNPEHLGDDASGHVDGLFVDAREDRRIWKRRDPNHGSTNLSLRTMAILYDAEGPLTQDELAARLLAQLTPSEQSYIEAWDIHSRERRAKRDQKRYQYKNSIVRGSSRTTLSPLPDSVARWITHVFLQRLQRKGQPATSLVRDPDGRLRPGPRAPRVVTIDGRRLTYTPETRRELDQAEHDQGRGHLVWLTWLQIVRDLGPVAPDAQAQLFIMLMRRLLVSTNKTRVPLDERVIGPRLDALARLADGPTIRHMFLRRVFDAWYPEKSDTSK